VGVGSHAPSTKPSQNAISSCAANIAMARCKRSKNRASEPEPTSNTCKDIPAAGSRSARSAESNRNIPRVEIRRSALEVVATGDYAKRTYGQLRSGDGKPTCADRQSRQPRVGRSQSRLTSCCAFTISTPYSVFSHARFSRSNMERETADLP